MRAVLAVALVVAMACSFALRRMADRLPPLPQTLYSWMEWHGCPYGSCSPAFHPVPDGSFTGIACSSSGWCMRHVYTYWTDENCNRLTACPMYKPKRARDERGR